jgi:hypothetical protein
MAVNDLWLALPIVAVIVLLCIFTASKPPVESNTHYYYMNGTALNGLIGGHGHFFGIAGAATGASYQNEDGSITVLINSEMPQGVQNFAERHENCHARQYLRNDTRAVNERELECYLMFFD